MNKLFLCASEEVQSTHKDLLQEIRNEGFNLTPYNQQECSKNSRVLVLGGDGSLNYFLNLHKDKETLPQILYLACGTGNDFSRLFKNREPTLTNFFQLIKGSTIDLPLAECNGEYFINVASGGELAKITNPKKEANKERLGKLSYYLEGFKASMSLKKSTYKVSIDGSTRKIEAFGYIVAQGVYAGGGIKVSQSANIHPCLFDCLFFKAEGVVEMIRSFIELQKDFSDLDNTLVDFFKCKSLVIEPKGKEIVKLDGEPYSDSKFYFKHSTKTLSFLV